MTRSLLLLPLFTAFAFSQCVVSIDIGHSKKRGGAISAHGTPEYQFNKILAMEITDKLSSMHGVSPHLINGDDKEISLSGRSKASDSKNSNLFLSIHHDSVKEQFLKKWKFRGKSRWYCDRFSGHGLFVSEKNKNFKSSLGAATKIGESLWNNGFDPSLHHAMNVKGENKYLYSEELGIYRYDNLSVLRRTSAPSVLIEAGIILNRDDELEISDPGFQDKFSTAVANGVRSWCGSKGLL